MKPEAVLFDLDNTLINRKLAFQQFSNQFIETFLSYTDSSDKNIILQDIIEADQDGYRNKKELYGELLSKLKFKRTTTLEELLDYWFATFFKCTVLMIGAMDVIVVSDAVQVKKPDKRIYDIALAQLGVTPQSSVYVGDHPQNDMMGAHGAGLTTIWLEGFRVWDVSNVQPDYTISELEEIKEILSAK